MANFSRFGSQSSVGTGIFTFGQSSGPGLSTLPLSSSSGSGGIFSFGPSSGSGLFAQPQSSNFSSGSGGSLFGSQPASTGTTTKLQEVVDRETGERYANICAMDCYKNKSLEELRLEDYQAKRLSAAAGSSPFAPAAGASSSCFGTGPGTVGGAAGTAGLFGSSTGGNLFGQGSQSSSSITPFAQIGQGASGTPFGTPGGGSTGGTLFSSSSGSSLFGSSVSGGTFGQGLGSTGSGGRLGSSGGMFGTSTGGTLFGSGPGGSIFGPSSQSTGGGFGGTFGASSAGGMFGQSSSGTQFGSSAGSSIFGPSSQGTSGCFGRTCGSTGGGTQFGFSAGGSIFGPSNQGTGRGLGGTSGSSSGGGMFGQATGGGFGGTFGASSAGGVIGQSSSGTQFGSSAGSSIFGPSSQGTSGVFLGSTGTSSGGGIFGQGTGSSVFGQTSGGSVFGTGNQSAGGSFLGQANSGSAGGAFGQPAGASVFGGSSQGAGGGGAFGHGSGGAPLGSSLCGPAHGSDASAYRSALEAASDPYGVNQLATASYVPPRSVALIVPRTKGHMPYVWKSEPESVARLRPTRSTPPVQSPPLPAPRGPETAQWKTPSAAPASAFLRSSSKGAPGKSNAQLLPLPAADVAGADFMPPLRQPRDSQPSQVDATRKAAALAGDPSPKLKPIKPNLLQQPPETTPELEDAPAAASLVPKLTRAGYYSSPSNEAMSKMSEAQLRNVDNLEIGRYGYGSIRWPGLTDVRGLDFDADVSIEKGSATLHPGKESSNVEEGLNKQAVITLEVRPTRSGLKLKSKDILRERLEKIAQELGGTFISYDMERWIFQVPHFSHC